MKILLVIILIVCQFGCDCSKKNKMEKNKIIIMEKFDIVGFNKNKSENEYIIYNENDTITKLYETDDYYMRELSLNGKNFKYKYCYNKKNGSLISEFSFFYNMPIGTWKEYDENGKIIKLKNYDENFTFTIDDLVLKLRTELKIDLNSNENNQFESISINREYNKKTNKYFYNIDIPSHNGKYRFIKIDGISGKILINEIVNPIE